MHGVTDGEVEDLSHYGVDGGGVWGVGGGGGGVFEESNKQEELLQ